MNIEAWANDCKVLNIEEKESDNHEIRWFEAVIMKGTNVNTVTVDKAVASDLEAGKDYDLLIRITEQLKSTQSGNVFKIHKFKVVDSSAL